MWFCDFHGIRVGIGDQVVGYGLRVPDHSHNPQQRRHAATARFTGALKPLRRRRVNYSNPQILVRRCSSCGATRPQLSFPGSERFAVEFGACWASRVSGFSGAVRICQKLTLPLQVFGA